MIHPAAELKFINDTIGFGVVATELIPKGTMVWALDQLDRVFTESEYRQLVSTDMLHRAAVEKYAYRDRHGSFIFCWDHGKYVNHSFFANCLGTIHEFEVAVRDIHAGEQLTDDYGTFNLSHPFHAVDEGHSRKQALPDDIVNFHSEWDRQLGGASRHIHRVSQPLRLLIAEDIWASCVRIAEGRA